MSVRLSCPSCNTSFALDALPADRRAVCPRCGDVFPIRGGEEEVEKETGDRRQETGKAEDREQRTEDRKQQEVLQPKSGLSMRSAVLVAVTMGLVGLAIGLMVYFTREPKPQPEPPPQPPAIVATPPAQLTGLGYLPAECNVVFAVQPGPILELAKRTNRDPRELLAANVPDQLLTALDATGVSLTHIDHIAGGIPVGDVIDLRLALVLVLKYQLPDESEFLKKLKAKPVAGKPKYQAVEFGRLPLMVTRVSPTVWVFGFGDNDLAPSEKGGFGPGGTQFRGSDSEGVRKMIASVPPEAAVWIATDDDSDWTKKPMLRLLPLPAETKKALPAFGSGRGAVVALTFEEKSRMRVFVRTVDEPSAARVRTYFGARAAEVESATAGGGGTLAHFDGPLDTKLLQRFLNDAK